MRKFICEGFGKRYEIEAISYSEARYSAARKLIEEDKREEPPSFLVFYFTVRAVELQKVGRKSVLGGRNPYELLRKASKENRRD